MSKLKMMLVFTIHAGIYDPCWYLRFVLVFTIHAGIYDSAGIYGVPFVSKLKMILVFTIHAGIYTSCWFFAIPAWIVNTSMNRKYQHEL